MTKYIYRFILTSLLFFSPYFMYGINTLSTSGTWAGGTLNSNFTVNLTGTVTVTGVVIIDNGVTLTINANGAARKIKAGGNINQIFHVKPGGKLVINGTSANIITIDGGATFEGAAGSSANHPFTKSGNTFSVKTIGGYSLQEAIHNENGTLELTYVTITNVNGSGNGGGILINGENAGETRKTTLRHCNINNCYSKAGSAIHIVNTNNDSKTGSAENTRVLIEDSTIEWNYAIGDNAGGDGGTIRTNGSCLANLYLTRVTVQNNYTAGCGGGIYWNAAGSSATTCVFNGCTFTNNGAKGQGGAMMLESNFNFNSEGGLTTISNNYAGTYGGGIVITSYGGSAFTVQPNDKYYLTYTFTDKLTVTDNTANVGGGISFNFNIYKLNSDFSSEAKNNSNTLVSTTINFNGATISNNTARGGEAGGIRIYNNTANWSGNKRTIEYHVNINGGTISNNTAATYGGGIYTFNADIKYDSSNSTMLTISNNSSGNDGGGIYVSGGKTINLGAVEILSNKADNGSGGAIYLSSNNNTSFQTSGTSVIKNNYCINNGGAVYVSGGKVSLKTPTITGNGKDASSIVKTKNGGAVYVTGDGSGFTADGVAIIENNASLTSGGAIYSTGTVDFNNSATIKSNASANGGAIYTTGSVNLKGNSEIESNTALSSSATNGNGGAFYVNGGSITASDGTTSSIKSNYSSGNGGALFVDGGSVSLVTPTISDNGKLNTEVKTLNGGAVYVTGDGSGFTATGISTISNNASTTAGGAIYVNDGNINMAASTLQDNTSKDGGAAYVYNGNFTTTGATGLSGNTSTNDGGALYVSGGTVNLNTPTIGTNTATNNGGAIYSTGDVTLNGTSSMTNNTAKNGGAIYSTGAVTLNGTSSMANNTAKNGGAIYTTGTVTLKGNSTMTGNVAEVSGDGGNGGAIYVYGGSIVSKDGSTYYAVEATNNSAKNGGVFYVNGDIDLGYTVMENNTASGNGGAVVLNNGTFSMANNDGAGNASTIKGNRAVNGFGGGLYMSSDAANIGAAPEINWEGGVFDSNEAKAGGAVAADGFIKLDFAATMENNIAKIGGGLYLSNGVDMKFADGLIRNNSASTTNTTYDTAENKDESSVEGVGGGIFMSGAEGKITTLDFTNTEKFGIYNNVATNAAADICVNGNNTDIKLPNVSGLELKGFDVPGSKLYWMEDYFTDKSYTSNSTNTSYKGTTVTGHRYENLLQGDLTLIDKYIIDLDTKTTYTNTYLCLDLGYDLVFVDLIVKGLDAGDVAAINCEYPDGSGYTLYRKVLFTGKGKADNQFVTRKVALPSGYWKFEASDWSFQYTDPEFYRGNETSVHTEDIFISRKDNDVDANGYDVKGFRQVTANFGTVPPPVAGQPDVGKVKQFQKTVVNRMKRN